MVVNNPLIRSYFLRGVAWGGSPKTCHDPSPGQVISNNLGGLGPVLDEAHDDLRFAAVATSEEKPVDVVARLEERAFLVVKSEQGVIELPSLLVNFLLNMGTFLLPC